MGKKYNVANLSDAFLTLWKWDVLNVSLSIFFSDSYAAIEGTSERHVKEGSQLILYCTIVDISGPPSFVFWYRDADVVNYSEQTGVSIITNHEAPNTDLNADFPPSPLENPNIGEESTVPEKILVSTLRIDTVRPKDAGTYTCAPSNARNHSVVVHVIKGQFLFLTLDWIFISFDNKIWFLDLSFNSILDFQRSLYRDTLSKFNFFAQY